MKRPSQNDRVYAILKDGRPHTMREIHARAGFMRLNSRVAELRKTRELDIVCWREGPDYVYLLRSHVTVPDVAEPEPALEARLF